MRIVIIGLGTIGRAILKSLVSEGHSITVIDEDSALVSALVERYDVSGAAGNGACMDLQREVGVERADLVIALTRNDELNVFACLTAKRLGVKNTVARVRNPAYRRQIAEMKDDLGISLVVNPERETAGEIFSMLDLPSVARVDRFAEGKALLVGVVAEKGCALIGESLLSLGQKLTAKVLICAVQRGDTVVIPSGSFVIEEGDRLHFTSDVKNMGAFLTETGLVRSPIRHVMIVGGGRVGFYLADALSRRKYAVKLIEANAARAETLAAALPRVTVACGNGTQHDFLLEEGIEAMDAFAALTEVDEENIIVSMFARKRGVKKTIAQIENDDLFGMLDELGVANGVSPKSVVASRVLSYVRALCNTRGSGVLTLYRLVGGRVEALEFAAKKPEPFYDKPLRALTIRKNCLVACIIRGHEVLIPDGSTTIRLGDKVVVVTTHTSFGDLSDVFV